MIGFNPSHVVLLRQDPLSGISDNDKPEKFACDEDGEGAKCRIKVSVLIPAIASICFNQLVTPELKTELCGFMKLINN